MLLRDPSDLQRLIDEGAPEDALPALEAQARRLPTHATTFALLARAYEATGRWDDAFGAWQWAAFLMPNSPVVHAGRARVLQAMADAEVEGGPPTPSAETATAPPPGAAPPPSEAGYEPHRLVAPGDDSPDDDLAEAGEPASASPVEEGEAAWAVPEAEIGPAIEDADPFEAQAGPVEGEARGGEDVAYEEEPEGEGEAEEAAYVDVEREQQAAEVADAAETPGGDEEAPEALSEGAPAAREAPPTDDWEPVATPEEDPAEETEPAEEEDPAEEEEPAEETEPAEEEEPAERISPFAPPRRAARDEASASAPTGPGVGAYDDLDRLIDELESARIVPDPTLDNIKNVDLDDDIDDMVSETLARIYATQHQYAEAAGVYEQLAQQQPERSAEFLQKAAAMRSKADQA